MAQLAEVNGFRVGFVEGSIPLPSRRRPPSPPDRNGSGCAAVHTAGTVPL